MGELLFNPQGRIVRNRFWQGLVLLTVATVLISAGSVMVSQFLGLVHLLLIYPYICVYGKRLHDAGTTAWWTIGVWVGAQIVGFAVGLIIGPMFISPEDALIQQEMAERLAAGDFEGFMEGAEIVSRNMLPLNLIGAVAMNAVMGLIVGYLKTEPRENKHGPVPGTSEADTFG